VATNPEITTFIQDGSAIIPAWAVKGDPQSLVLVPEGDGVRKNARLRGVIKVDGRDSLWEGASLSPGARQGWPRASAVVGYR
jgi:hypothetical protein